MDLALIKETTDLTHNDVVLSTGISNVVYRSKSIVIDGQSYDVNPNTLIAMIKNVTQTIGEYKQQKSAYSAFIIASLRKARRDMVAVLESKFHINWTLDKTTNESKFYV